MTWKEVELFCEPFIIGRSHQVQQFLEDWKLYCPPSDIYLMDYEDPYGSIMMEWHLPGLVIYRCEFNGREKIESMTTFPIEWNQKAVFGEINK